MDHKLIEYLEEKLKDENLGHDLLHLKRVYKNAQSINEEEKQDEELIFYLSFIHDLFDEKFYKGNIEIDLRLLLTELNIELKEEQFNTLISDLKNFGFKGGFETNQLSRVGQIVSDADRLDAMGAIGIIRTISYSAEKNFPLILENTDYIPLKNKDDYRKKRPSLWHFKDKLLLLKDKMFTAKGKQLAIKRHQFMELFLQQLEDETGYSIK